MCHKSWKSKRLRTRAVVGGVGRGQRSRDPKAQLCLPGDPQFRCRSEERPDPSESDNPALSLLIARSSLVSHSNSQSLRFLACKMGTERSNYRLALRTE